MTAFMLSRPRPVKAHLDADFPARWNKPIDAAFRLYMLGATADQHRYGPFPPLAEMQREMADRRKADRDASKAPAPAVPASAATGRWRMVAPCPPATTDAGIDEGHGDRPGLGAQW